MSVDFELVAERLPDGRFRVILYTYDMMREPARGRLVDATRGDDLQSCIDDVVGRDPQHIKSVGVEQRIGRVGQVLHPDAIGLARALTLRYLKEITPIERVAQAMDKAGMPFSEVLVPEQCAQVFIDGKFYHLTLQEMPK